MPWTPKQVRLFFSKASPLSISQRDKVASELRANPSLGHATKGMTLKQMATPKKKKQ